MNPEANPEATTQPSAADNVEPSVNDTTLPADEKELASYRDGVKHKDPSHDTVLRAVNETDNPLGEPINLGSIRVHHHWPGNPVNGYYDLTKRNPYDDDDYEYSIGRRFWDGRKNGKLFFNPDTNTLSVFSAFLLTTGSSFVEATHPHTGETRRVPLGDFDTPHSNGKKAFTNFSPQVRTSTIPNATARVVYRLERNSTKLSSSGGGWANVGYLFRMTFE